MYTKYQIVPISGGGCYCMARNDDGTHIEVLKGHTTNTKAFQLVFDTPEEAQEYIDKNLGDKYTPQWFFTNTRFLCPKCGGPLKTQCVVEASKTLTGFTERICSCQNEYCLADWEITTDEEGNEISTKRYFVG